MPQRGKRFKIVARGEATRRLLPRIIQIPKARYNPVLESLCLNGTYPTNILLTDFYYSVILLDMNTTEKADTVWFTTKGQVVIPLRLRKQFHIEDGTRAVVTATSEGILLKPVTAALIKRGRGILKRKPGDEPLTE